MSLTHEHGGPGHDRGVPADPPVCDTAPALGSSTADPAAVIPAPRVDILRAASGTRLIMVRHGESVAQRSDTVAGHSGCLGLTDVGRAQAAALGKRLQATGELASVSVIHTSRMLRARQTADIVASALGDVAVEETCALCEYHPGEGDGLSQREFDARWPTVNPWDPHERRAPGSETWAEMAHRVAAGLDALIDAHRGRTVVVVTHSGVIIQAMMRWLDLRFVRQADLAWLEAANASLTSWQVTANPFRPDGLPLELVTFSDAAHLVGPHF
ncbi:MAG TPA: histidine phosphatase family protein [Kineosporiaceae bacterium]|nr:histidine phosphatase family protein [Kineosporiaceae bacterium]